MLDAILRRPRAVLVLMLAMIIGGIWSYIAIPKESDPDIKVPVLYISIPLAGISPEDSERLLAKPVEEKLRGLDGVKEMTSIASEGHAGILVQFLTGIDLDKADRRCPHQGRRGQGAAARRCRPADRQRGQSQPAAHPGHRAVGKRARAHPL